MPLANEALALVVNIKTTISRPRGLRGVGGQGAVEAVGEDEVRRLGSSASQGLGRRC